MYGIRVKINKRQQRTIYGLSRDDTVEQLKVFFLDHVKEIQHFCVQGCDVTISRDSRNEKWTCTTGGEEEEERTNLNEEEIASLLYPHTATLYGDLYEAVVEK